MYISMYFNEIFNKRGAHDKIQPRDSAKIFATLAESY